MLERLDWDSAAAIGNRAELDAEVARLRRAFSPYLVSAAIKTAARPRLDLSGAWLFRQISDDDAGDPGAAPDAAFTTVTVPDYRLYERGCYRRRFVAPDAAGKQLWLCFGAADYEAEVWLDGQFLGSHRGYFAPFHFDVTDQAGPDVHQLDVRVRRARDWVGWDGTMTVHNHGDAHGKGLGSVVADRVAAGAGLLGPVSLELVAPLHIADVYVHGDPATGAAEVSATVVNCLPTACEAVLGATVSPRTRSSGEGMGSAAITLAPGASRVVNLRVPVPGALPWSLDRPALYWLRLTLAADDGIRDEQKVSFGFRTVERRDDGAILLNGQPIFLRGTTTIGCLWRAGWEGDEDAIIGQLLRMKALFANVVRVHVHALPPLVYDCADRVGLLIYQDAPYQWHCFAPVKDRLDDELHQVDELIGMVRNHPSVIIYSLTNEMHMHDPFHPADRRYLEQAYERCGALAHNLLIVQDFNGPDRPPLPVQSYHEYPGYFTETARWTGSVLDKEPRDGRVIVSEFGGGALHSWQAMREIGAVYQNDAEPSDLLLPDRPDDPWPVEQLAGHILGGTIAKTQRVVGRRRSWADYRAATDEQQARVLAAQVGRLRRSRVRVAGAVQHYFADPAPRLYNAWVDLAIVDHTGEPTAGYFALREAFRPLTIELLAPARRAFPGQALSFNIWLYNDYVEPVKDLELRWIWRDAATGADLAGGERRVEVAPDSAELVLNDAFTVPGDSPPGNQLRLEAQLLHGSRVWCSRQHRVAVWPRRSLNGTQVAILGAADDAQTRLAPFGVLASSFEGDEPLDVPVLVLPGRDINQRERESLHQRAAAGGKIVLLERRPGEDLDWITGRPRIHVLDEALCDLVQPEAPLAGSGLDLAALTDWNTADGRVIEYPLLMPNLRQSPVWASCGEGLRFGAIQEATVHYGAVVLCQLVCWRCLDREPAAWATLRHLLTPASSRL